MASISYWFLSPSVILAILGKLKGWDRTRPTPAFDWRSAKVDVVIPAKNAYKGARQEPPDGVSVDSNLIIDIELVDVVPQANSAPSNE